MPKLRNCLPMNLEDRNLVMIVAYVFSTILYGGSWLQLDVNQAFPGSMREFYMFFNKSLLFSTLYRKRSRASSSVSLAIQRLDLTLFLLSQGLLLLQPVSDRFFNRCGLCHLYASTSNLERNLKVFRDSPPDFPDLFAH